MKKQIMVFVVLFVASTIFARKGKMPEHMKKGVPPAEIERFENSATLVVHTNTKSHLMKSRYDYYIDNDLVGQDNKLEVYFTVKVKPGTRWFYVVIKDKIFSTARFTLESGKIYYLLRKSVPGGNIILTQTKDDFAEYISALNPAYLKAKPSIASVKMLDVIDEDDIVDEKEDFEEDVRDDPEKHGDVLNFQGF